MVARHWLKPFAPLGGNEVLVLFFCVVLVCLWWFFVVVSFLTPPQAVAVPLCRRARPVKREFFFPTTTKCFLCEVFLNIVGL